MACHKELAEQIVDQGDYVLALKAKHGQLFDELNRLFSYQLEEGVAMDKAETFDVAQGRQETRTCWLMSVSYLEQAECGLTDWKQLASVIVVATQVLKESNKA